MEPKAIGPDSSGAVWAWIVFGNFLVGRFMRLFKSRYSRIVFTQSFVDFIVKHGTENVRG